MGYNYIAACIMHSFESHYMMLHNLILPLLMGIQDVSDF